MNNYRININYAKALFMLATDRQQADRVADDMRLVGRVVAANHELGTVFANPTVRHDKKTAIVEALFGDSVSDETMAFLRFVVKKKRSVNLRGISEAYLALYRDSKGIVLGELVTHRETDDSAKDYVRRLIEEYTGKEVELHTTTDPHMLGGFKMEFDHNMYDARLRTKILKLRKEFAKNEYESKL
ncbi:MAG: ATP synthase F1 subunit delta [Bacteroidales bacterium]|nr:ATP synthase F1 subunit delta [Bacteroidales bacterium]